MLFGKLDVKLGGSSLNGYDIVKMLSPSWKHYSGEKSYPVRVNLFGMKLIGVTLNSGGQESN